MFHRTRGAEGEVSVPNLAAATAAVTYLPMLEPTKSKGRSLMRGYTGLLEGLPKSRGGRAMLTTTTSETTSVLSHRDLALLRAVAAGQCELINSCGPILIIDGRRCCDQLAARRLTDAGLIELPPGHLQTPARLTAIGRAALTPA
jgi:hypothetical protein